LESLDFLGRGLRVDGKLPKPGRVDLWLLLEDDGEVIDCGRGFIADNFELGLQENRIGVVRIVIDRLIEALKSAGKVVRIHQMGDSQEIVDLRHASRGVAGTQTIKFGDSFRSVALGEHETAMHHHGVEVG
jgi:hypothetical protein